MTNPMIETAKNVLPMDAVEHAKDVAQGTISDLVERVERLDLPIVSKPKKRRRRRSSKLFIVLTLVGFAALAVYLARRRSSSNDTDVAPDAFGRAVEESQAFGRPVATPGA
jgi:hypothetical protein